MKILNLGKNSEVEVRMGSCGRIGPACNCNTQCTRLGKKLNVDVRENCSKSN